MIAVIGGTGMNEWPGLVIDESRGIDTPYGTPSGPLHLGRWNDQPVIFFARHGEGHKIPPHAINYRANLWALYSVGVRSVISISAVGGIHESMGPAQLAVPDDLIDYSWGRRHSYSDGPPDALWHVEFSDPYTPRLRAILLRAAADAGIELMDGGVMAVTQGPRLETPAEVRRLRRDGCDMIGMTGMPEAGLARELGLEYASLAVSVNWAAGLDEGEIHAQIEQSVTNGMARVGQMLALALPVLSAEAP